MFSRKWSRLALVILCTIGLILIFTSNLILRILIKSKLILTPNSEVYHIWQHFPELIQTDIYVFNWTNPEDIYNLSIKPNFQELGPYRYHLDLLKSDIKWHENGTVSYKPSKYFYYVEDGNNGNLQDLVTFPNPLGLTTAYLARRWGYLGRRGVSLSMRPFLSQIQLTKTVEEVLFLGYDEPVLKIANSLPAFAGLNIPPIDRFGWFYQRNGTDLYDAGYNVGTGKNSTLGQIYQWNYLDYNPFFENECSKLDISAGEFFQMTGNYIKIFSVEFCRSIILEYVKDEVVAGIPGKKYIMGNYMLDNGTIYPENKCYCNGNCIPAGIFNVSTCRYGTPAFGSLPHFYKADPCYRNAIQGLKPDSKKHEFYIIIEPNTGLPLKFRARIQLNMLLQNVTGIKFFESVPSFYVPIAWINQNVDVPKSQIPVLKQLLNLPYVIKIIGCVLITLGIIIFLSAEIIKSRKDFKKKDIIKLQTQETKSKKAEEDNLL